MARPLRIQFAGALYHVFARGNNREAIFLGDADRKAFLEILGRVCNRYHWRIWAWCLMNNHYHLLVETLKPSLCAGMREVNGVYAQRFNRRHDRVGHVLQGRYKAALVDKQTYLLELLRYIVLNPVRAGLARFAVDWRWSSYRSVIGSAKPPTWLVADDTLLLFHHERREARPAYESWVADGIDAPDPTRDNPRAGFIGNDAFVERVLGRIDRGNFSREIPLASRPAPTLESIAKATQNRNETIRRAYSTKAYSMAEIARHFGIHRSTVQRVLRNR